MKKKIKLVHYGTFFKIHKKILLLFGFFNYLENFDVKYINLSKFLKKREFNMFVLYLKNRRYIRYDKCDGNCEHYKHTKKIQIFSAEKKKN